MANGTFNLTFELNAQLGPSINRALQQLGVKIGSVKANVNVAIPKDAARQLGQLNSALNNTGNTAARTSAGIARTSKSLSGLSHDAGLAAYSMRQFGFQANLAFRRAAAYSLAVGGMLSAVYGFKKGVGEAVKFETAMIKVAQVTNRSVQSLDFLQSKITELSKKFGASSKELIGATRILAQAGLTAREVEKSITVLAKSDLAPTFDSMAESAEGMIAVMRQFKIQAHDMEGVFGSLNAIAGSFAVESADLISVIRRAGGAFAAASSDLGTPVQRLNELLALFTAVRSTTRESADSIGTGFRTIFTRMQRPKTLQFLRDINIELSKGSEFVGPFEAVRRLNRELSKLDPKDYRFTQIIEELGGFRQVSKVIPLIQQFPEALKALSVAEAGATSLTKDTKVALTGLEQQLKRTKEEFQGLFRSVAGSDVFRGFADSALKLATALSKVAEALIPILPALAAAVTVRGISSAFKFGSGFAFGPGAKTAPITRQRGGPVPGSGKGDKVPAMLEPNEYVISGKGTSKVSKAFLDDLNAGKIKAPVLHRGKWITTNPPHNPDDKYGGLYQKKFNGDVSRYRRRFIDPVTGEEAPNTRFYRQHRQLRQAARAYQDPSMRPSFPVTPITPPTTSLPLYKQFKSMGLRGEALKTALKKAGVKFFNQGGEVTKLKQYIRQKIDSGADPDAVLRNIRKNPNTANIMSNTALHREVVGAEHFRNVSIPGASRDANLRMFKMQEGSFPNPEAHLKHMMKSNQIIRQESAQALTPAQITEGRASGETIKRLKDISTVDERATGPRPTKEFLARKAEYYAGRDPVTGRPLPGTSYVENPKLTQADLDATETPKTPKARKQRQKLSDEEKAIRYAERREAKALAEAQGAEVTATEASTKAKQSATKVTKDLTKTSVSATKAQALLERELNLVRPTRLSVGAVQAGVQQSILGINSARIDKDSPPTREGLAHTRPSGPYVAYPTQNKSIVGTATPQDSLRTDTSTSNKGGPLVPLRSRDPNFIMPQQFQTLDPRLVTTSTKKPEQLRLGYEPPPPPPDRGGHGSLGSWMRGKTIVAQQQQAAQIAQWKANANLLSGAQAGPAALFGNQYTPTAYQTENVLANAQEIEALKASANLQSNAGPAASFGNQDTFTSWRLENSLANAQEVEALKASANLQSNAGPAATSDQVNSTTPAEQDFRERLKIATKVRAQMIEEATIRANRNKLLKLSNKDLEKELRSIRAQARAVAGMKTYSNELVGAPLSPKARYKTYSDLLATGMSVDDATDIVNKNPGRQYGPNLYDKKQMYGKENRETYRSLRKSGMSKRQARYMVQEDQRGIAGKGFFSEYQPDDKTRQQIRDASNLRAKQISEQAALKRKNPLTFSKGGTFWASENKNNRRRQKMAEMGKTGRGGMDPMALFALSMLGQGVAAQYGDDSKMGSFISEASNVAMTSGMSYMALTQMTGGKKIDFKKLKEGFTGGKGLKGNLSLAASRFGQNKSQNFGRIGTGVAAVGIGAALYAGANDKRQGREDAKKARSTSELRQASGKAQRGGALTAIGSGAAMGAVLGSVIPVWGTAVGAAVGGLVGGAVHFATNEIDKEIREINMQAIVDESAERVGTLMNMAGEGRLGSGQGARSMASQMKTQLGQLDLASGEKRDQLKAQITAQAPAIQTFINNLAESSETIEKFKAGFGGSGTELISIMAQLSGKSFQEVEEQTKDLVNAFANSRKAVSANNDAMEQLRNQFNRTTIAVAAFADASDAFASNMAGISLQADSALGNYGMPQFRGVAGINSLDRPGAIANPEQFMEAAKQASSMFDPSVQADMLKQTKQEVDIRNALPDILMRVASRADLKGEDVTGVFEEELKKMFPGGGSLVDAITSKFDKEITTRVEEGPGAYLADIRTDPNKAVADLMPDSQTLSLLQESWRKMADNASMMSGALEQVTKIQQAIRDREIRGIEIRANAGAMFANMDRRPEDAAAIEGMAAQDKQIAIAGKFRNNAFNPQALGAALTDRNAEIDRVAAKLQTDPSLENQKKLQELTSEAQTLKQALENLADSTDNLTSLQKQWELEEGKRQKKVSSVEDYVFGDNSTKRELDTQARNFKRLEAGESIEAIPMRQRQGLLSYMKQFEGDERFDKVREKATRDNLLARGFQPEEVDALVKKTEKQKTLEEQMKEAVKLQTDANNVLLGGLNDAHGKVVSGITTAHENFIKDFERVSLTSRRDQINLEKAGIDSRKSSLSKLQDDAKAALGSDKLTKYGIDPEDNIQEASKQFELFVNSVSAIKESREKAAVSKGFSQYVTPTGDYQKDTQRNLRYTQLRGMSHNDAVASLSTELGSRGIKPTTEVGTRLFNEMVNNLVNEIRNSVNIDYKSINAQTTTAEKDADELYKNVLSQNPQMTRQQFDTAYASAKDELPTLKEYATSLKSIADQMTAQNLTMPSLAAALDSVTQQSQIFENALYDINMAYEALGMGPIPIPASGPVATEAMGGPIFRARGTDTVPAMLTPGEFVVRKSAAQRNAGLLRAINSGTTTYAASGGFISGSASHGLALSPDSMMSLRQFSDGFNATLSVFNQGLNGFATATSTFNNSINRISDVINKLNETVISLPSEITLTGTHTVEVKHVGLGAITGLDEHIKTLILNAVNVALGSQDRTKPPSMR